MEIQALDHNHSMLHFNMKQISVLSAFKKSPKFLNINCRTLSSVPVEPLQPKSYPPSNRLQPQSLVHKKIRISDVDLSFVETEGSAENVIITFPGSMGEAFLRNLKLFIKGHFYERLNTYSFCDKSFFRVRRLGLCPSNEPLGSFEGPSCLMGPSWIRKKSSSTCEGLFLRHVLQGGRACCLVDGGKLRLINSLPSSKLFTSKL
jgi:hypothetical protein